MNETPRYNIPFGAVDLIGYKWNKISYILFI